MEPLKQERRFFCGQSASDAGENRHPQIVVRELASKHGFNIIGAVPQSLFEGWDFWIEYPRGESLALPSFFDVAKWKPVGQP